MNFRNGDEVYICSLIDTGEVVSPKPHPVYEVNRDADSTIGDHHFDDLEAIPFAEYKIYDGFQRRVRAWIKNGSRRLEVRHYTTSGHLIDKTIR